MAKRTIKKASTSVSVYIFVQDSSVTTGAGLTGLAYNTASLVAYYVRPLGSATAITLATQTVTGAYSSGGFVEVSAANMPGVYRLDLPDAVIATGADSVVVELKGATNMSPVTLELDLVAFDPQDAADLGLTALTGHTPNTGDPFARLGAPAGASVSADIAAAKAQLVVINADTDNIQTRLPGVLITGTATGGSTTTLVDTARTEATTDHWKWQVLVPTSGTNIGLGALITGFNTTTDTITVTPAFPAAIGAGVTYEIWPAAMAILAGIVHTGATVPTVTTLTGHTPQTGDSFARIGATGSGLTSLASQASVDAVDNFIDTEVADIQARLPAALVGGRMDSSTGAMAAGVVTAAAVATGAIDADAVATDAVTEIVGGVWNAALASYVTVGSAGRYLGVQGGIFVDTTATGTPTTTTVILAAASAVNNYYNDLEIVPASGAAIGQSRVITSYTGSTRTVTIDEPWTTAPSAGDAMTIVARHSHSKTQIQQLILSDATPFAGASVSAILTDTAEIGAAGAGLTALATQASLNSLLTTALTESYAADGAAPTVAQALFLIQQSIGDFSISGTTLTVKKLDGTTSAATYTLDSATAPTSRTRAT